jgi:hypothetical protein
MKESLSRDHIRVLGIHAHIQRMVNGMLPEAKFQTLFQQQQYEEAGAGNSDFQAPVVSGLTMGSGEYFVQLSIGTPAKSTYLVVDTGSDILWLQCSPCANCYQQSGPVFNPLASSTYATVRCGSKLCLDLDISGCQQSDCLYQVCFFVCSLVHPSSSFSLCANCSILLEQLQQRSVSVPAKIFLTSKFSYLLFSNPTHKTKSGTANRWETTNSNPPGLIIMIGKSETRSNSQIIFITLFSLGFAMRFARLGKLWKNAVPKPFC